ncbi:hypothetical protein [Evansella cellulosilytica]|uniref:Uncharacterized protein n=1 Tax=Evansella cellulosilytica (strain ATCC 21833 / DSM 2522 / FERM P-1141 / JCM 9156 / N-4) TaxID=649639 RepID=E6TY15_EVAC2|nr:hypothetical protein [Evansella cellulosilytica]ADU31228.1 hypothetical protein Bcell_2978 [Evansella cellulosilytica DSM 2522]
MSCNCKKPMGIQNNMPQPHHSYYGNINVPHATEGAHMHGYPMQPMTPTPYGMQGYEGMSPQQQYGHMPMTPNMGHPIYGQMEMAPLTHINQHPIQQAPMPQQGLHGHMGHGAMTGHGANVQQAQHEVKPTKAQVPLQEYPEMPAPPQQAPVTPPHGVAAPGMLPPHGYMPMDNDDFE